jgi:hypothetical protein
MCGRRAEQALAGLGDARLGEWREWSGTAFHIRRRLTAREALEVGPVVDVRGTPEARRRADALGALIAMMPAAVIAEEVGGP